MTRSNAAGIRRQYGIGRMLGTVGAVVGLVAAAACSGSDDIPPSSSAAETTVAVSVDTTGGSAAPGSSVPALVDDGPLAEVCPSTIAIQTSSLPIPVLGPLYALLGPQQTVDAGTQRVSSPLVRTDGTIEDVTLELRSGGPAVEFRNPLRLLAEDPDLLLGQASTALAVRAAADSPTLGVVTLTDRSRDAIIVDPATYPGVDTVEAVRDEGIEVRHVTDEPFIDYFAATGALDADQLVPGFDGEPAAFVQAAGSIAQQGDILVEPVLLPALPQWGKAVTTIDAASAGWAVHDDALVVRATDADEWSSCLERLVPVIQQAIVDYVADPGPTDTVMANLRGTFAPLTRLTPELMDAGTAMGVDAGVFGNGANSTVGDFDTDRLGAFLPDLAAAFDLDPVPFDELMTNAFIDPAISIG